MRADRLLSIMLLLQVQQTIAHLRSPAFGVKLEH